MSDFYKELEALRDLQDDFQKIREIDQTIQSVKEEKDYQAAHHVGEKLPPKPEKDNTKSTTMRAEVNSDKSGTYAVLLTLCLIVVAVVALFIGLNNGALLGILAAGVVWLGCAMGPVWTIAACGLGTWIGWSCWSNANTTQTIILILMTIGAIIFAFMYKKADKEEENGLSAAKLQAEEEEKAYKEALEAYNERVEAIKQRKADNLEKQNKSYEDKIKALIDQQQEIRRKIEENNILIAEDKTEEVVEFLISQLKRKSALSLEEALQQYDDMVSQRQRERIAQLDRQLQGDRNW